MNEAAHTISLISPSKSWKSSSSFNTSNSDPTSFSLNERETRFASGMERDRSDTKKFSNLSPEILVEWIAPYISVNFRLRTLPIVMVRIFKDNEAFVARP